MHEMKYVSEILKNLEKIKFSNKLKNIKKINITVGEFSGIEPLAIQNSFLMSTQDTDWQDILISCRISPLVISCRDCGAESRVQDLEFICLICQSRKVLETSGRGVFIDSVEGEA
jgi:hydrogenase nickel incorporation protein HypA/HybF